MQAVKALTRLYKCAGPSEPWLLHVVINTQISCAGPNVDQSRQDIYYARVKKLSSYSSLLAHNVLDRGLCGYKGLITC